MPEKLRKLITKHGKYHHKPTRYHDKLHSNGLKSKSGPLFCQYRPPTPLLTTGLIAGEFNQNYCTLQQIANLDSFMILASE